MRYVKGVASAWDLIVVQRLCEDLCITSSADELYSRGAYRMSFVLSAAQWSQIRRKYNETRYQVGWLVTYKTWRTYVRAGESNAVSKNQ